ACLAWKSNRGRYCRAASPLSAAPVSEADVETSSSIPSSEERAFVVARFFRAEPLCIGPFGRSKALAMKKRTARIGQSAFGIRRLARSWCGRVRAVAAHPGRAFFLSPVAGRSAAARDSVRPDGEGVEKCSCMPMPIFVYGKRERCVPQDTPVLGP